MKELDPLCFKDSIGYAVTNRGELIPCCRCDEPTNLEDPLFKDLLSVSKISDHDNIKNILDTKEWKQFYTNLSNNIGPLVCWHTCIKDKEDKQVQTFSIIDPDTGEIKHKQRR